MADFSSGEFRPFPSWDLEARLRHIESFLVSLSVVGERDNDLAENAGGNGATGGGTSGAVPESDVEFDPGDGHTHDGDASSFIKGIEFETSFGATPTRYKTETITDDLVTDDLHILVWQKADAPTGKSSDENEMDPIVARAVAGSGAFTVYLTALEGPVVGNFKFAYLVTRPVAAGS